MFQLIITKRKLSNIGVIFAWGDSIKNLIDKIASRLTLFCWFIIDEIEDKFEARKSIPEKTWMLHG